MAPERDSVSPMAGLVHDLNNVFQTIAEAAELLSGDANDAGLTAALHRSVERGRRIASGILQQAQAPVSASQPLEWAAAFARDMAALIPESRFEVHVESCETAILPGPSSDWERVFMNLFLNSLQATRGTGRVTARASRKEGEVLIQVQDDGPGIPENILTLVFHPGVSTRGKPGGLGLSIVESIVEKHKASIRAGNCESGGALFEISIPIQ